MANMYRSVLAGGGTSPTGDAVAADVLTGKTFSNADGIGKTGTMPNNGAVSGQASPSQPYTIPAGYHNGNGIVTASISGRDIYFVLLNRFEATGNNYRNFVGSAVNNIAAMSDNLWSTAFDDSNINVTCSSATVGTVQVKRDCIEYNNTGAVPHSANDTIAITAGVPRFFVF